jgi:hypothetical protein
MPLVNIPLPVMFSQSSDETSLPDQVGARLINGWVEMIGKKPIIRKLFGLEYKAGTGGAFGVDGQFWWDAKNVAISVCNGRIYKMTTPTTYIDITGDALTVIGPTTFACNQYQALLASGGKIVSIGVENLPDTTPALALGSTHTSIYSGAFDFYIGQTKYSHTEVAAGTATGLTTVIPRYKYGALALDIDAAKSITIAPAAANAIGYSSAAAAIDAIPAVASTLCRMGVVSFINTSGDHTLGTTHFDAATTTYTSYIRNSDVGIQPTRFITDPDTPTVVSHVAWMDGYFLANELNSPRFWWSDSGEPFLWDALSFASAEGHSDLLQALHVAWLEITLFGRDSLETYYDDGTNPFSRIDGGILERGCLAPYSIVNAGGTWVWLDKERKVITLQGRQYDHKSGPYDSIIGEIEDVTGAWAVYFAIAGHSFYVLTFPTIKWTVIWNMTTDTWTEWGLWDSETATFGMWPGKSYCYARSWDLHLLGDASVGKVYAIRPALFQENNSSIRTIMRTAHMDHGTMAKKRSRSLLINVKRGQGGVGEDEPVFTMRYRDDNRSWSNERTIGLGEIGEIPNIVEVRTGGIYRTRQYEFTHTANSDFRLNAISENVEALG